MDRYHRQILLPQVRQEGQNRIFNATIMLVGAGALGCSVADQLCRAGVGKLIVVDRDIVDYTNLHRQILFTEADAHQPTPKPVAVRNALAKINPGCQVFPVLEDLNPSNVLNLIEKYQPLILVDSTDNVATRFLLNDIAVKTCLPLVYGGCVGVEGRLATIIPGKTPCLRCLFPKPPDPSELPTCDTAGIFGPVAAMIGAMQASEVVKLLVNADSTGKSELITIDLWSNRFRSIDTTGHINSDCPVCQKQRFDFLDDRTAVAISLCGRNTVQYHLEKSAGEGFLDQIENKLTQAGRLIFRSEYLIHLKLDESKALDIFADGRVLIHGCNDPRQARSIVAQWLG